MEGGGVWFGCRGSVMDVQLTYVIAVNDRIYKTFHCCPWFLKFGRKDILYLACDVLN